MKTSIGAVKQRNGLSVTQSLLHFVTIGLVLALASCGGGGGGSGDSNAPRSPETISISGKAVLEGATLEGAVISIGKLDIAQPGETRVRRGKVVEVNPENALPTVKTNGTFSFQLNRSLLINEALYSISLKCQTPYTQNCPLRSPLHALISGERIKRGDFNVSILTEIVYQRLGYYIAAGFKAPALLQEMDALALMLLSEGGTHTTTYESILKLEPNNQSLRTLRRPKAVDSYTSTFLKDISDNSKLQQQTQALFSPVVANLAFKEHASLIEIRLNQAFIASGSELFIADIKNPEEPKIESKIRMPGVISDIKVDNSYLFITYIKSTDNKTSALRALKLGGDSPVIQLGEIDLPSLAERIAINGNYLFITYARTSVSEPTGIHAVDISNEQIHIVSSLNIDDPRTSFDDNHSACGILVSGDYAYVTSNASLNVVNITNPANPEIVKREFLGGSPCSISKHSDFIYVASEYSGVYLFSISDEQNPQFLTTISSAYLARRILVDKDTLYIPSARTGIKIADNITDPSSLSISAIDTPGSAIDIAISGQFAFVTDESMGLQVIDISMQTPPPLAGKLHGRGDDISIIGSTAYVLATWPGVSAIDISSPSQPEEIAHIDSGYLTPHSLTTSGELVYVATGTSADIFSLNSGSNILELLSTTASIGTVADIAIDNEYAFIAGGDDGVHALDVSNPNSPFRTSTLDDIAGEATNIAIKGQFAFVAYTSGQLLSIDINSPYFMQIAGSAPLMGTPSRVVIEGNTAYVTASESGLQIFDISTLEQPTQIGNLDTPGDARDVIIRNGIAYIADDIAGVQAVDINNPGNPVLIGAARTHAGARGITSAGNHIFVATRYGLEVIQPIPSE